MKGVICEANICKFKTLRPSCLFKSSKFYEDKFDIIFANWYSRKSTDTRMIIQQDAQLSIESVGHIEKDSNDNKSK